jgi:hypothetical protein
MMVVHGYLTVSVLIYTYIRLRGQDTGAINRVEYAMMLLVFLAVSPITSMPELYRRIADRRL